MSDLHQRLHAAAAAPASELDTEALGARVAQRRRRRAAVVSAAAVVVVLSAGGSVLAARGGSGTGSIRTRNGSDPTTASAGASTTTWTPGSTGVTVSTVPGTSDTTVPPPAGGEFVAANTSGLGNLDDVTISGTGVPAGSYAVGQCPASSVATNDLSSCVLNSVVNVTDGKLLAKVRAFWWMRSGQVDCGAAPGTCIVGVRDTDPKSTFKPVTFALAFDPAKQPVITVTPATGLVDGQQVEIHGVNLGAGLVNLTECLRDTYGSCQYLGETTSAADGSFSATFPVQSVLHWGFHGQVDTTSVCGVDGDCVIEMSMVPNGFTESFREVVNPTQPVVLAFAPSPPPTTNTTTSTTTSTPTTT